MASFNRVILLGNITRDIELRYVGSGIAVTDVGLAVNDRRKNANGEWVEETTFVDVTLWGRIAEVAARFSLDAMPGKQMAIDADLSAGLIDEKEAKLRRKTIEAESNFFGAMDGAS